MLGYAPRILPVASSMTLVPAGPFPEHTRSDGSAATIGELIE
jgi:hypothetical protein